MAPPVSEVAIIPLVKGADPLDENSEAAKILNLVIQLATEQPGYQRMVWGLDEKDPTVLVMIVGESRLDEEGNQMKPQNNSLPKIGMISNLTSISWLPRITNPSWMSLIR